MSYIRSGSNPEELYIVCSGNGVAVNAGHKPVWYIPPKAFEGLIKKYYRTSCELPCEHKGTILEEVWVEDNGRSECKVKLSYEEHSVIMWDVTWDSIVFPRILQWEDLKTKKVYVVHDPLHNKAVCVHEKPNRECKICKGIRKVRSSVNHYGNNLYPLEEKKFVIQTEDKLTKIKK
jgi:hypothetical protein